MRSFEIYSALRQTDVILAQGVQSDSVPAWKTTYANARASQIRLIGELYIACVDEAIEPPAFLGAGLVAMHDAIDMVANRDLDSIIERLGRTTDYRPCILGKMLDQMLVVIKNSKATIAPTDVGEIQLWTRTAADHGPRQWASKLYVILDRMHDELTQNTPYVQILTTLRRRLKELTCPHGRRADESCPECNVEVILVETVPDRPVYSHNDLAHDYIIELHQTTKIIPGEPEPLPLRDGELLETWLTKNYIDQHLTAWLGEHHKMAEISGYTYFGIVVSGDSYGIIDGPGYRRPYSCISILGICHVGDIPATPTIEKAAE